MNNVNRPECNSYNTVETNSCDCDNNRIPYNDYKNLLEMDKCKNKFEKFNKCDCLNLILCYQAWMTSCEAELFCDVTSRLKYELYCAKNLCEVNQIIDSINTLFCASALKENALAEVIKAYNSKDKKCNDGCHIDCHIDCPKDCKKDCSCK